MNGSRTSFPRLIFTVVAVVALWVSPARAVGANPPADQAASQAKPAKEAESAPHEEVQQLEAIRVYRVVSGHFGSSPPKSPAQIFNPFEARKPRSFHGSIYEFHRNDNLDARNFFDPVGQPLPEFKRNQFGAQFGLDLGGRLSLFGSYDGLRIVRGSTIVSQVPSLAQRRGDFSELDAVLNDPFTGLPLAGNLIPPERLHPAALRLLEAFPLPNRAETTRNYVNSQPEVTDADSLLVRADYRLGDSTKMLGRYSFVNSNRADARPLPAFASFERERDHELNLSLNQTFSDRFTGQFGFNFGRNLESELSANSGRDGLLDSFGIAGLSIQDSLDEGYPNLRIAGYARFGDGDSPGNEVRNRFSFDGYLQYALDDHDLSFGAEVTFVQLNNLRSGDDRRGTFTFGGSFTGDALADFLFGLPEQAERATGSDRVDLRRAIFQLSFNDDWRISPQFNLNLGVSYFYYQPHRSIRPVAGFHPLVVEPSGPGQVVISGTPEAEALGFGAAHSLVRPDRNDFAPQVGVAYSPFGNNRLVLRASYSIFYDSIENWQAVNFMGRNYPFFQRETAVSSVETPQLDLGDPFQTAAAAALTIRGIERDLRSAYYQFWKLVVQKKLFQQWNLDIGYFGSKGTRAQRMIPGNIPLPGPGSIQKRRPDPDFGSYSIISGGASFVEHRFFLDAERQLADSFSLKAGFNWGREITDAVFRDIANPRDLASERAVTDAPLVSFSLDYIWDLPFGGGRSKASVGWLRRFISGWRLAGGLEVRGGEAFTVDLAGDPNNDGLSDDRPDRISSGELPPEARSVDGWIDVGAFSPPAEFAFGSAGRNILRGPGRQVWDIALSKRTTLGDGHFLEFRVEFFNALNHVNFDNPEDTFGTSSFGQIFGADEAREIEIALKYSF